MISWPGAQERVPSVGHPHGPFCMTMIDDGLQAKNMEEKGRAQDIIELVADILR